MNNYPYQDFQQQDQIRLLSLQPGQYDDPLVGSLCHVNVVESREYDAVSYCWENCMENVMKDRDKGCELEITQAELYDGDPENAKFTTIKVKLKDMSTHPSETVRAMYYSIGGARPPGELTCDGHCMTIGGELHSALRRFRLEDRQRSLWVDAICINQSNLDEKAAQIQRMSQIYRDAQAVLVWLGESPMKIYKVGEALQTLDKKFDELSDHFKKGKVAFKNIFLADPDLARIPWDHLADFLRRTWFNRIWCLQEIVNARNAVIYAAESQAPWDFFEAVIGTLREFDLDAYLLSGGDVLGSKSVHLVHMMREYQYKPGLIDLLRATRQFKSTLPSDKVFALLGLVSKEERDGITVDYRASTETIYKNLAITQMSKRSSLDVLYHCCKSQDATTLHLPSWAPNWTQQLWHEPYGAAGLRARACLRMSSTCITVSNSDVAGVCGRVVDEILLVDTVRIIPESALTYPVKMDPEEYEKRKAHPPDLIRDHLNTEVEGCGKHVWNYVHRQTNKYAWLLNVIHNVAFSSGKITPGEFEMLWRTFMCNQTLEGETPGSEWGHVFSMWVAKTIAATFPWDKMLQEQVAALARNQEVARDLEGMPGDVACSEKLNSQAREFDNVHTKWCNNRRFFKSKGGRFGWCPDGVEIGDKIAVVYGLNVPLVLRQVEKGFEVCGDCYLHGIMDGEAMSTDVEPQLLWLV